MASKAQINKSNSSIEEITAISDLKPRHTNKIVHVKVLMADTLYLMLKRQTF